MTLFKKKHESLFKWVAGACSSPSLFCLVPGQAPGIEEERRFVTGGREWTDISFLIELCRLNYYLVIVITIIIIIIIITSFDTGCSV